MLSLVMQIIFICLSLTILTMPGCVTEETTVPPTRIRSPIFDRGSDRRPRSVEAPKWDESVLRSKVPDGTTGFVMTCWQPKDEVNKVFDPLYYPIVRLVPSGRVYFIASDLCLQEGQIYFNRPIEETGLVNLYVSRDARRGQEVIVGFETNKGTLRASKFASNSRPLHTSIEHLKLLKVH